MGVYFNGFCPFPDPHRRPVNGADRFTGVGSSDDSADGYRVFFCEEDIFRQGIGGCYKAKLWLLMYVLWYRPVYASEQRLFVWRTDRNIYKYGCKAAESCDYVKDFAAFIIMAYSWDIIMDYYKDYRKRLFLVVNVLWFVIYCIYCRCVMPVSMMGEGGTAIWTEEKNASDRG